MTAIVDIEMQNLYSWLQNKYEQKYGGRLQQLKRAFFVFYNLCQQIIDIYNHIYEQSVKSQLMQQYPAQYQQQIQPLKIVVTRTCIILQKITENEKLIKNEPGAITMSFCERFIRNFGQNLNILCTFYHSLNHCQILNGQNRNHNKFKNLKKKIVQGINKLYNVHNKIRQLYFKNEQCLKIIQNHKLFALLNIGNIMNERLELFKITSNTFANVQQMVSQFYQNYKQKLQYRATNNSNIVSHINNSPNKQKVKQNIIINDTSQQAIKKLMRSYFRIMHQFTQAQAQLQYYLKPVSYFCEQIKNSKKSMNYNIADSINTFRKISSQLLKQNYSLKNFKKVRIQDLNKSLLIIIQQMITSSQGIQIKQNNRQMLGHRLYKQLGLSYYQINRRSSHSNKEDKIKSQSDARNKAKEKVNIKLKDKNYKQKPKNTKIKEKQVDKQKIKSKQKPNIRKLSQNSDGSEGNNKNKRSTDTKNNKHATSKNKQGQQSKAQKSKEKHSQSIESRQSSTSLGSKKQDTLKISKNKTSKTSISSKKTKKQIMQQNLNQNMQSDKQQQPEQQQEQNQVEYQGYQNQNIQYIQLQQQSTQNRIQIVVQQICECALFIMDCMKQLDKVQNSGLLNMIQQYKQKLNITSSNMNNSTNTNNNKKLLGRLYQFQKYINQYYRLNQNVKQFQRVIKQIVLQEFNVKINVIISMEPSVDKNITENIDNFNIRINKDKIGSKEKNKKYSKQQLPSKQEGKQSNNKQK